MELFNAEKIKGLLKNSLFSKNILIHKSLPSTNDTAKELYKQGAQEGTVVLAEEQTAGRGRMDRMWVSPPNKNILLSILLKPSLQIERIYTLTLAMAVSVTEAVKKITGLSAMIKWPNDIYLNKKKLGGILTEFRAKGLNADYVILGLGLNVNWCPGTDALFPSTCLRSECGKALSRNELLALILLQYNEVYENILAGNLEGLHKKCNDRSIVTGSNVSINTEGEIIEGTALGIDIDGALLVKGKDGGVQKVLNGDVSLRS
ncbi:biotin--[acetyl-CoA-carboxylase] ligase [Thermodesulfobacteriota bacterium]